MTGFSKEDGNCHSCSYYNKKKVLNKLKINDFPWSYQRSEVTGLTTAINSGGESREHQLRYAYLRQQPLESYPCKNLQ